MAHRVFQIGAILTLTGCGWGEERVAESCTEGESYCSGSTRYYCVDQHTETKYVASEDCGRHEVCVMADVAGFRHPMCAIREQPDARCPDGNYMRFCDGNILTMCSWGYVTEVWDCEDSECLPNPSRPDEQADCADSSDPCYQRSEGWSCEGEEAILCSGQHNLKRIPCAHCAEALADASINLIDQAPPATCQ